MPCGYEPDWVRDKRHLKEIDDLTRWLCFAMHNLLDREPMLHLPDDLATWWSEHRKADDERRTLEHAERHRLALIESAKSKLTRAERAALNL